MSRSASPKVGSMTPSIARGIAIAALVAASVAACSPPAAPDEERRPEPRADAAAPPAASQAAIVQAADAYKDRARVAGAQQEAAAERQRAELDAATR